MLDSIHEFSDLVSCEDLRAFVRESEAQTAIAESDALLDRLHSDFCDVPLHGRETNLDSLQKCLAKPFGSPLGVQPATGQAPTEGTEQTTVMLAKRGTASYDAELRLRRGLDDFIRRLRGHYGLK